MKNIRYYPFLMLLFLFPLYAVAQDEEALDQWINEENQQQSPFHLRDTAIMQIGLYAVTTPFLSQQSYGVGVDFQAWYTDQLGIGLSLSGTGRKVNTTFGYNIGEAKLFYLDASLFNEYKFLQQRKWEASVRLYTGLAMFRLSDNSMKEKYTWYDEYGIAYEGERALPVAANYFLRIAPAFVLRYHLDEHVLLEGSSAYNFFAGKAQYGQRNAFSNYVLQLGVKISIDAAGSKTTDL